MVTAVESGATVEFDADSLNPRYTYGDERGRTHEVWIADARHRLQPAACDRRRRACAARRSGGSAARIRRSGASGASSSAAAVDVERLRVLPPGYDLVLEGDGDIWRILSTPEPGRREIRRDPANGLVVGQSYLSLPKTWEIEQLGARPKQDRPELRRRARPALHAEDPRHPRVAGRARRLLRHRPLGQRPSRRSSSASTARGTSSGTTATRTRTSTASATRSCWWS